MPTIDIRPVVNVLITGLPIVLALVWVLIHMSAVRDLHDAWPKRPE
jgi:hypothetical protein